MPLWQPRQSPVDYMHYSSLENMQKCHDRYMACCPPAGGRKITILDMGGADVNGSYRAIFSDPSYEFLTADIVNDGIDIHLPDPYHIPLPDASIDVVLSGQMLEHCEFFWLTFREMVRILRPEGFLFLIAPSAGPIHRYPVDCYRFYPDAYTALARWSDCRLEQVWQDERGPWRDLVGVFRKSRQPLPAPRPRTTAEILGHSSWDPATCATDEEEATRGRLSAHQWLAEVHQHFDPRGYLEIGVRQGRSLALARCPALGIDPLPDLADPLPATTRLCPLTSDDFFDFEADAALTAPPDLIFIDGMHLFEYALRDFMQVERRAHATALILLDDIFPNHPQQANRHRRTRVWTGDVWKLLLCLREYRPDLLLLPVDTAPTGMLIIAGLDPGNRILWDNYNPLMRHYREEVAESPPDWILTRDRAMMPDDPRLRQLFGYLRRARGQGLDPGQVRHALRAIIGN